MYLYEELIRYTETDAYPFHMPGHKRRLGSLPDPYRVDITEIDGFDNLHHAEGLILEAEERAARLYGASKTYFLVNGSSCGILAAISACSKRGRGRLIMSRGSHKSAYHAISLNGLEAIYLYPDSEGEMNGRVRPRDLGAILQKECREGKNEDSPVWAVFITSPTYEGIVSDVREIAAICHEYGLPLIVDEAHGAHFGMHEAFPESALKLGADIVIQSLHKTLPSLTQTALLHVCTERVDLARLALMLDTYQSSSPSYLLMASMDQCIGILQREGRDLFDKYVCRLRTFYEDWNCEGFCRPGAWHFSEEKPVRLHISKHIDLILTDDPSRILVSPAQESVTAARLYDMLRLDYHIQPEMLSLSYVLLLSSLADDEEGFSRLRDALKDMDRRIDEEMTAAHGSEVRDMDRRIDEELTGIRGSALKDMDEGSCIKADKKDTVRAEELIQEEDKNSSSAGSRTCRRPISCMRIFEAEDRPRERLLLQDSAGKISGEYIYLYPPGSPLLLPGERIGEDLIRALSEWKAEGCAVQGLSDHSMKTILTVKEET